MARIPDRQDLSVSDFSILHELLLEKCYAHDLTIPQSLGDYELYGYNNRGNDEKSIRAIMMATNKAFKIDGRALSAAVKNYYAKGEISLPSGIFNNCIAFLEFDDLSDMVSWYFKEHGMDPAEYEPPIPLKYLSNQKKSKSPLGMRAKIDDKLENLRNTVWWCYSHFYSAQQGDRKIPMVQRIPFFIKSRLANGDYELELRQQMPYTTFKGRIVRNYSGDNVLICELTSEGKAIDKRVYMNIHVNLAASGTIFVGGMMRHTDNAAIRLSTFVMEKIKPTQENLESKIFDFSQKTENFIKPAILDFLYDRSRNIIKLPRNIYSEQDFNWWIKPKKDKSNRNTPEYDMMVACPIRSLGMEQKRRINLRDELVASLKSSVSEDENWLKNKVDDALRKCGLLTEAESDLQKLQHDLSKMIADLKAAQTGFNNIYCPLTEDKFKIDNKVDGSYRLEEQINKFRSSRSLLLIFPFPVASGVLVEAGWAMFFERKIPLMIVYRELEDLPLLLRKADTLKSHHIFMTSLKDIGGMEGIADWIASSGFERFLPQVR